MRKIVLGFALLLAGHFAHAGETPAPANAKVYFINIKDGDTVTSPVTIRFGLSGMGIAPAGTQVENTGHHHLIIDDKIEGAALDERSRWTSIICISARARRKPPSPCPRASTPCSSCSETGRTFRTSRR